MFRYGGLIVSAVCVVCISVSGLAQSPAGIERSTTSTISTRVDKELGIVASIVNRRFTFAEFYADNVADPEHRKSLLLLEEFKSERSFQAEGQQGTVTVRAWFGSDASPSSDAWTFSQDGDEGMVSNRFYKVIKYGCCGAEATGVYFNLTEGRKVFTSSSDLFGIEVPNTPNSLKRYVGYCSGMASLAPPESSDPRAVIGAIEYGSEQGVIDRVLVRRTIKGIEDFGTPKLEAIYQRKRVTDSPLELWGVDKKNDPSSLSAFSMVFSFGEGGSVTIPVSNDRFDLAHAVAARGFAVVRPAATKTP